jgi:nucleotide-binding universal stress UspA family protein
VIQMRRILCPTDFDVRIPALPRGGGARHAPWRHPRASAPVVRAARGAQAEMIVMGVQGRGAVDLMFFGSTTHHVIRESHCPVLTIRGR